MIGNGWTVDVIAHILMEIKKDEVLSMKLYPWDEGKDSFGWDAVAEWESWLIRQFPEGTYDRDNVEDAVNTLYPELYGIMMQMERERAEAIGLLNGILEEFESNSYEAGFAVNDFYLDKIKSVVEKAGE